ncbi:MAG: hypothetical protein H7A25_24420 [Leptospiraceae bacterium]|nr:hypothetical protein [Leptospiraceae bacterium]
MKSRNYKKIVFIIVLVILSMFIITGCSNKKNNKLQDFLIMYGIISNTSNQNSDNTTLVSGTVTDLNNILIDANFGIYRKPNNSNENTSSLLRSLDNFTFFEFYKVIKGSIIKKLEIGYKYKFCINNDCNSSFFEISVISSNIKIITNQAGVSNSRFRVQGFLKPVF